MLGLHFELLLKLTASPLKSLILVTFCDWCPCNFSIKMSWSTVWKAFWRFNQLAFSHLTLYKFDQTNQTSISIRYNQPPILTLIPPFINMFVCWSVCLFVQAPVYPEKIPMEVHIFLHPYIPMSVLPYVHPHVCPSIHSPLCMSACLSIHLSVQVKTNRSVLSISGAKEGGVPSSIVCKFLRLYVPQSNCPSTCLSVYLSICL